MGRLMKYDLRAALRQFVPLWTGTLILALVNSFTVKLEFTENRLLNFLTGLMLVLYVLAMFGIMLVAVIYAIQRFYQSMLKDEGYLTFTLPVSVDSILWSKALTALILFAGSAVVCVASFFLFVVQDLQNVEFRWIAENLLTNITWQQTLGMLVCFAIAVIASGLAMLFQVYLAMALGQLTQKNRMGASIAAFVGISVVMSFLATLPLPWIEDLIPLNHRLIDDDALAVSVIFLCTAAASLVQAAIYYFPTRFLFKRKLYLE